MTITAERITAFISANYVVPARQGTEHIVMVPTRQVWKELDGEFPITYLCAPLLKVRGV